MSAVLCHFGSKDNLVEAIVEYMHRTMLASVAPALEAETTPSGKLNAYIRSCIKCFGTHRAALLALTSTATNCEPGAGRRFDELGLSPEIAEQVTMLDAVAILADGQRAGEFGDFPLESTAMALHCAVNSVVEKIVREPGYDAVGYGEDLAEVFG